MIESAGAAARAEQLRRLILTDTVVTVGSMTFLVVVHLTVSTTRYVLLLAALVGLAAVVMLLGLRPLQRGSLAGALAYLASANWGIALAGTAFAPFGMPILAITSLLPVALAIPYVDRERLRGYAITSGVVASGVVALGTLQDFSGIEDDLPSWIPTLVTLTFTPVMVGLIAFIAFQNVDSLNRALDDSVHARGALVRAQARIVTAADEARRRIERDLHDGAQQRLTAVAIGVGRLHARAERDGSGYAADLGQVRVDLADARTELRRLAHGLYPSALGVDGLAAALRSEADRFARRVRVDVTIDDDVPLPVQTAVYFCCLEAMQNAFVHAGGNAMVMIDVARIEETRFEVPTDGSQIHFVVRDDGHGFDTANVVGGHGFENMRDRVGAFGGNLTVMSAVGVGTTVSGAIPLASVDLGPVERG